MPVDSKLLARAYRRPQDLRIDEALTLAEQLGFEKVRTVGSHTIFHHPKAPLIRATFPRPLNLQEGSAGKAKAYQVQQMLEMAQALGIIDIPGKE